jgi:hypothetical protein
MSSRPLSPQALVAVAAAIEHLAHADHPTAPCPLGYLLGQACAPAERHGVRREVRAALGLNPNQPGALAAWAGGRTAPEVAKALKQITKP